jgi:hypothetical protein
MEMLAGERTQQDVEQVHQRHSCIAQKPNVECDVSMALSHITLIAASPDSLKEPCAFLSGERFPRSRHQPVKRHLHDPNTMQREYPIP